MNKESEPPAHVPSTRRSEHNWLAHVLHAAKYGDLRDELVPTLILGQTTGTFDVKRADGKWLRVTVSAATNKQQTADAVPSLGHDEGPAMPLDDDPIYPLANSATCPLCGTMLGHSVTWCEGDEAPHPRWYRPDYVQALRVERAARVSPGADDSPRGHSATEICDHGTFYIEDVNAPDAEKRRCRVCVEQERAEVAAGASHSGESKMKQVTIFVDETPIDVTAFYVARGWKQLPPCPTMRGGEIKAQIPGFDPSYTLYQAMPEAEPDRPVSDLEAVGLTNGMRFYTVPPATYYRGPFRG